MSGKGDRARPVDKGKYDKNYERIFRKKLCQDWYDPQGYGYVDQDHQKRPNCRCEKKSKKPEIFHFSWICSWFLGRFGIDFPSWFLSFSETAEV